MYPALYHKLFHLGGRRHGRRIDDVVGHPHATLLRRRVVQSLGPLHRLYIQVRNIALAIRQLHSDLEVLIKHHVVLPQAPLPVVNAQNALLHLHLVGRTTPAHGVVLALLAARPGDCHAALGKGQPGPRTPRTRGLRHFGGVATPGVRNDTPGMC